jgi:hypothetical protein
VLALEIIINLSSKEEGSKEEEFKGGGSLKKED